MCANAVAERRRYSARAFGVRASDLSAGLRPNAQPERRGGHLDQVEMASAGGEDKKDDKN